VFEKLTLVSPDICDGQLIITPNTDTVVKTNRDSAARMRYRILEQHTNGRSQTVIKVHDGGRLSSGSYSGQATLEITSLEDFGVNQTMVVLVKVIQFS
jgi:nuclear pore complex protein Nup210